MENSRFKFRAWHKKWNLMATEIEIGSTEAQIIVGNTGDILDINDEYSNLAFMQFTGLYDKNSKEIYEGDIVEEWIYPSETKNGRTRFLIHSEKISNKGVVQYNNEEACYKPKGIKGFWYMNLKEIEVIGNIFENKDLLS